MPDYTEEIYERAEIKFSNIDDQIAWLDSFENPERGATDYTKDALKVRNDLRLVQDIDKEIEDIDSYDKIEEFKERASGTKIEGIKADILNKIKNKEEKLDVIEIGQQEEFIAEAQALKYTYSNPNSPEEKAEALQQLKELDKNIARTVVGWETRRRNQTLRLAKV
jgi:hypothetical protein